MRWTRASPGLCRGGPTFEPRSSFRSPKLWVPHPRTAALTICELLCTDWAYNRSICAFRWNATRRTRRKRGRSDFASKVMNISSRKWWTNGMGRATPGTKFAATTGTCTFCGETCPYLRASGTWFHSARLLDSSRSRLRPASTDPDRPHRLHPSLPAPFRFPRCFLIRRGRGPEARGAHTGRAKCS